MGDISPIGPPVRRAVEIAIQSCWSDHRFEKRSVLPAVDAMQLLMDWARAWRPGIFIYRMGPARFDKFLTLPEQGDSLEAYCELTDLEEGGVRAALLTRIRSRSSRMTRFKSHAQMDLWMASGIVTETAPLPDAVSMEPRFMIDAERIYTDLVPFGPAYRNIVRPLAVTEQGVRAVIRAPAQYPAGCLGSAFVLDAALHAACVWGQRFAGVVAFPVGLMERVVRVPTRPGGDYVGHIVPVARTGEVLVFDVWILDCHGRCCEKAAGIRMRDVSGGRVKPPNWIGPGISACPQKGGPEAAHD